MKKLLVLLLFGVLLFPACKNCCEKCERCSKDTKILDSDDNQMCRTIYVFNSDYQSDKFDYYVQINKGAILKITPDLVVFINRGLKQDLRGSGSFSSSFKFWEKTKGAPAPHPNETPTESKNSDPVDSDEFFYPKAKSNTLIQIVSLKPLGGDKNVINPPINPIGPPGPQ